MKRIAILISCLILFTIFTACSSHKTDSSTSDSASNATSDSELVGFEPKTLQITSHGKDKIAVSIEHERVNQVMKENSDGKISLVFSSSNDLIYIIDITHGGWVSYSITNNSGNQPPDDMLNGQPNTFNISENKVSFEIVQADIGEKIASCDSYTVSYKGANVDAGDMLAYGLLTDVLTAKEHQSNVKLIYYSDDEVLIRLSGEVIQKNLKDSENDTLWVGFYLKGTSEREPSYKIAFSYGEDNGNGEEYVQANLMQVTSSSDVYLRGDENPHATMTKNGCSGLIFYKDIRNLLSACEKIVITDQNRNIVVEEIYANAISVEDINIPPIPDIFPINDRDKDFFYPTTDDYVVIMVDMPAGVIYDYGYARTDFGEFYMPVDAHESPFKIVVIISYDEFGIANQRAKIIYASVADAMKATATRLDWLSVDELTGDEEADNKIRADFFESLDQNVFGASQNGDSAYQYFGHFDNVRYFASKSQNLIDLCTFLYLSYDRNSPFDEDGFLFETNSYAYEFPNFDIGDYSIRERTATITAFYSGGK